MSTQAESLTYTIQDHQIHISVYQGNTGWYLSYAGIYKSYSKLNLYFLGNLKRVYIYIYIFGLSPFYPNIFFPVFIV